MSAKESTSLLSLRARKQVSVIEEKLNKIGVGWYQYFSVLLASMLFFSEAAQVTTLSLTIMIISTDWDLSDTELGILGAVTIGGLSIGSAISTSISDDWGRVRLLRLSLICAFVCIIPVIFTDTYWLFLLLQLLLGISNGLGVPIVIPYILEICPMTHRSRFAVTSQLMFVTGQLYVIILALILIPDLDSSRWREIYLFVAIALLIAAVCAFVVPKESVFFLMNQGKNDEGIQVMNSMARMNNSPPLLVSDIESLSNFIAPYRAKNYSKFKELFRLEYMSATIVLALLWSICLYTIYGFLFSVRIIINYGEEDDEAINVMCLAVIVQIPVILFCIWLVQNNYIGRKVIFTSGWFATSCLGIIGTLVVDTGFVYFVSVVFMVALGIIFNIIFPFTCEIYHTRVRVTGFGFHTIISRLVATSAPIAMIQLTLYECAFTFLLFSGLALIAVGVSLALPYETGGKHMDTPNEKAHNNI